MNIDFDAAIIGAGVVGLATARLFIHDLASWDSVCLHFLPPLEEAVLGPA